jgi:hypothetical protein
MKSICLIGKGPSAVHADEFMNDSDDVAAINDGGIFTNRDVDYCFCTHNYYTTLRGTVHKIKNIITPQVHLNPEWANTGLGGMHLLDEVKNVNKIIYEEHKCAGNSINLTKRIIEGGICHNHTTSAAIHWLAKHGKYDLIKVVGVDGGIGYAPGAYFHQPTIDLLNKGLYERTGIKNHLHDACKEVFMRLAGILENVYDCKITLYAQEDKEKETLKESIASYIDRMV